jgi:hypothetical protein
VSGILSLRPEINKEDSEGIMRKIFQKMPIWSSYEMEFLEDARDCPGRILLDTEPNQI